MKIELVDKAELMELAGLDGDGQQGSHLFDPSPFRNQL